MESPAGDSPLLTGLAKALRRAGLAEPRNLTRLTGGATMESWRFLAGDAPLILRRAPSTAFMANRPFGHATEAAVITAAREAGVTAPEVLVILDPEDGIGSGFVMRALDGTADPRAILAMAPGPALLADAADNLARIHALHPDNLPQDIPELDYRAAIAGLRQQFTAAGGDRPIIALGLRWLEENCPARVAPVLNHGDYRLGNLLVDGGRLTGVLDWELVHFGDPHEDIAFGCLPVWRFGQIERPAFGLGSLEDYFAAYEARSGRRVDPARFRYWSVYRMVWWALGCLRNAQMWRSGEDRMLERLVISRRTSEQELDLLLLLEDDAPAPERARPLEAPRHALQAEGEADIAEIASAVGDLLSALKGKVAGHDAFQLAVARNALGMLAREAQRRPPGTDPDLAQAILAGRVTLGEPGLLARLRARALEKLAADVPKYASLAVARRAWTGEG